MPAPTKPAIPPGFRELLERFSIAVLRECPTDVLQFSLNYFQTLVDAQKSSTNSASPVKMYNSGDVHNEDYLLFETNDKHEKVNNDEQSIKSNDDTKFDKSKYDEVKISTPNELRNCEDSVKCENLPEDDDPIQSSDDDDDGPSSAGPVMRNVRRIGVAGESYDPTKDVEEDEEKIIYPKSEEQKMRLNEAVKYILLFRSLDEEQLVEVIDSMFERKVAEGDKIIEQGDDGDNFYVIESGIYDIFVTVNGELKNVGQYVDKGSFGELALMYNCPRLATIIAKTEGIIWAMDRQTFRRIVLKKAFQKRKMYETLLENVPLLKNLSSYERMNVADALKSKTYEPGAEIVKQGDPGESMYFIEEGEVSVIMQITKQENDEDETTKTRISNLKTGDYFGELALITKQPRAASVVAVNKTKVAALDVLSFERLLGPCVDIMERNIENYESQLTSIFGDLSKVPSIRK